MDRSRLDLHRGGTGEPLVLVHGTGHTWRGWKPMLPLLEPRFDVLAVDLPGFGYSPALPDGVAPTVEALADAVESELDAAGFDTAHLAGNSLGVGERFQTSGQGNYFPYYVARLSADVVVTPTITWNAISLRYRNAFD